MIDLYWLPKIDDWRARLHRLAVSGEEGWDEAVALANFQLTFEQVGQVDATIRRVLAGPPKVHADEPIRLALLGSSTMRHLHAAIRLAGLRRRVRIDIYENDYGQYLRELADPTSGLYRFKPTVVLLALDAWHLAGDVSAGSSIEAVETRFSETCDRIRACWQKAREALSSRVVHQLALPLCPQLVGSNEHRLVGSRSAFLVRLNAELRRMADEEGADVLALDAQATRDGFASWHDLRLWHSAKMEVAPGAAQMFGELLLRVIDAGRGRSRKALVLDLDDTIWGGSVGNDGVEGLALGQGSALGEAFVRFQEFARELSRRGVILAVCSKNDECDALAPFHNHPEMALQRSDIASFVANWSDKPSNLRAIANELNIGIDSLVFVDNDVHERNLVRHELPMVAVPEISDEPAEYAQTLADAGYFEAVVITEEDRARQDHYRSREQHAQLRASSVNIEQYLRDLRMRLTWRRFDRLGLGRTVQLINKSNQFTLTARRYTEAAVLGLMSDERVFGVQLRLVDRFSNNGIIGIVIGKLMTGGDVLIDTWLMSCRVAGRQIEPATLNLVAMLAKALGARQLIGEYIPSGRNRMVEDHYGKLGFEPLEEKGGVVRYTLDLTSFVNRETVVELMEEDSDH